MKEKRYFCDYWFGESESMKGRIERIALILISSLILITFIGGIICYNVIMSNHGYELNSYSMKAYEHLDEIANNVIKKGVGIDLSALPDDVVRYEITSENDEIIFKYYLDNNKDMWFATSANMTVKLSNDFSIISKEQNFSSKEEYVKNIKIAISFYSIAIGIFAWFIIMVLSLIGCIISAFISKSHKNKNLS